MDSFAGREQLLLTVLDARSEGDPRAIVASILEQLVAVTDARRGYLEIYADHDRSRPQWTTTQGCSAEDESEIRGVTSRGIVAAALAANSPIHTPYAALDQRFASLPSVKDQRLEAVLCVPLGGIGGGVLYLEGRRDRGPFSESNVRLVETIGRNIWPLVDGASRVDTRADELDATRAIRSRLRVEGIAGRSQALAQVFEQIAPYAPRDVTVLITGASGTGKTQLARAIHDNSPRRSGPFVELNCNAIPEGLIESELFGVMPSAFPGAKRTQGKVEAAEGGTLFLDEIADIPFSAQGKLLQLLQSRQYYALASSKVATANVRLVVATNVDLLQAVAEKRLREDLYYRINVISIRMPSLAERRTDIPPLADALVERLAREHSLAPLPVSERARLTLMNREWRGNIRELCSTIERGLILANAESASQIEVRHLSDSTDVEPDRPPTYHESTRLHQRELVRRELEANNWNVIAVADRLDITRSHVYNLMHQFKLTKET